VEGKRSILSKLSVRGNPLTTTSQFLAGYVFVPSRSLFTSASSDFKRFPAARAVLSHFYGSLLMKDKSRYFMLNRGVPYSRGLFTSDIREKSTTSIAEPIFRRNSSTISPGPSRAMFLFSEDR